MVAQLPTKIKLKNKTEYTQKLNKNFVSKIFILSNLKFFWNLILPCLDLTKKNIYPSFKGESYFF